MRRFDSGRALLNTVAEDGPFDLYILDIVMPGLSGIDAGLELRKLDKNGALIYLTTSPDFALESYQARAFYYLLKPVKREQLFPILEEAVHSVERRRDAGVQVKTRDGVIRLSFDELLYAELMNRAVRYHLRDGGFVDSTTITGPFRDVVSPLLADKRFLLCGTSFLVNLHYVNMVDRAGAHLTGVRYLALPKSACTALRGAWLDYWLEGG